MRRLAAAGFAAALWMPGPGLAAEPSITPASPPVSSPVSPSGPPAPRVQSPTAAASPSDGASAAMGIGLEGYPYPYPIRFLPLERGRDAVGLERMAYMDVPAGAEAGADMPAGMAQPARVALLLGGRTLPGDAWNGTIEALAGAGWRVLVPDQIGMGKSGKPEGPWRFDDAAADTLALLDKLGIQRADVVGFSMGGMLAARFAHLHPERVRKLVLLSPLGLEDTRRIVPDTPRDQLFKLELGLTSEAYLYELTSQWRIDPTRARTMVALRERLKKSAEYPRWVEARIAAGRAIRDQPVLEDLPALPGPTLFVVGNRDRAAPGRPWARENDRDRMGHVAELAAGWLPRMQDAQLVRLETGHLPQLEQAEAWQALLLAFLRSADAAESAAPQTRATGRRSGGVNAASGEKQPFSQQNSVTH